MLHLCRNKNKLPILAVNRHPVCKGRNIASDKMAFLYAFAIITINKDWVNKLVHYMQLQLTLTLCNLRPQIRKEFTTH